MDSEADLEENLENLEEKEAHSEEKEEDSVEKEADLEEEVDLEKTKTEEKVTIDHH